DTPADGSGYALDASTGNRLQVVVLDRFPGYLTPTFIPSGGAFGVDLVASEVGLHRAYRDGATVYVETSVNAGASWVSGDYPRAVVAVDAATDSVPTLATDRFGGLYCWYHDVGGTARCCRSIDRGATWGAWAT